MKKNTRRISTYLLLLVLLAFTFAGCGSKDQGSDNTEPTAAPTAAVDNEPTDAPDDGITAIELTRLMGNGINLGNTMEAYGRDSFGVGADVTSYETFWGQPETTQEIIDGMKTAGFDTLRIPVAWTNAMKYEDGDYTIGEDYLNRVEEIVNYALNADMYVVVNDHWDGGWWGMFGSATQETRDAAMELYISMWTQIGNRFKDYSDKLILESANEELGDRLNDANVAADSGTLSEDECYTMANKINQTFVDTIRSTGGNNTNRFLLIAGYNTDIAMTADDRYIMPADTAKDKLLVSVHYYTPWGYAGTSSLSSWGSEKNYTEQNDLLAMMTKFTEKGYGVVIG
ncbi:MAG: glycoside hydrolase family 5 protein, partial [Mobilitalea sp.]